MIKIPPLRERTDDIPLLAEHFVKKYGEENQRNGLYLDPAAMRVLMDHEWRGNVRELENVIERAVVLSPGNNITADIFPKNVSSPGPETSPNFSRDTVSLKEMVGNYEKQIILAALEKTKGNQKKAAQLLSVNPTTLCEKLKRFAIKYSNPSEAE